MDRKIIEIPEEEMLPDELKDKIEEVEVEEKESPNKNNKKRKRRIRGAIVAVGISIILLLSAYNVAGSFTFNNAMLREQSTEFIHKKADQHNAFESDFHNPVPMENRSEWFDAQPKNIVNIESDGLKLSAYEFINENPTNKWIITLHGYRGRGRDMNAYTYHFYNEGYNVLVPDLRGCGNSEGKYVEMGYSDRKDVLKWIDKIIEKDPNCQIVLHGLSMGAATVMMTTGEKLPSNVKAAVEDCGYTSVWDQLLYVGQKGSNIPKPILNIALSSASIISKVKTGNYYSVMSSVNQLKKSTTPTLFIHGSEDEFVPFFMLDEVYNANDNIEKEKLVVEGATHAYSATVDPDLYYGTIFNFIDKYWDE